VQTIAVGLLTWVCWRAVKEDETRARLAGGAVAAVLAAVAAQCLNLVLPTPPKPIFDPTIGLQASPLFADVDALSERAAHSFPSARATLFAGLAITVAFVRPRIGVVALGCTLAPELARIALGLHYPADIAASFALAASFVQLAQMRFAAEPGIWLVRWERRSALTFYICAFLACWLLTDGFQDMRELAAQLAR
jgi:membrane-associated phospholipid phosphatase